MDEIKVELQGDGRKAWDIAYIDIETRRVIPVRINSKIRVLPDKIVADVEITLGEAEDFVSLGFFPDDNGGILLYEPKTNRVLPTIGDIEIRICEPEVRALTTIEITKLSPPPAYRINC